MRYPVYFNPDNDYMDSDSEELLVNGPGLCVWCPFVGYVVGLVSAFGMYWIFLSPFLFLFDDQHFELMSAIGVAASMILIFIGNTLSSIEKRIHFVAIQNRAIFDRQAHSHSEIMNGLR